VVDGKLIPPNLMPYLEAVLGFAIVAGAIWGAALLLRRLLRLDTTSAVLLSIVLTPIVLLGAGFLLSLLD
jgi:hypothetical protein